jgi:hypothetical protein
VPPPLNVIEDAAAQLGGASDQSGGSVSPKRRSLPASSMKLLIQSNLLL